MSQPLLEVRHVSKTFPGVRALDDVSLEVASGEIVALLGHNGSGKSTLVKILAGVYSPDPGGEVHVRGEDDAAAADNHGTRDRLHFIHQDLGLIPLLTTIENLDLSRSLGGSALLPARTRSERRHADELIREFGADFDVRLPIAELTPAERAIVAIARSLDGWRGSDNILVLDEPTAALHDDEVVKLSEAVRRVAGRGAGVIFISQRLEDVLALADRVVVLRDGRVVANQPKGAFDHESLIRQIAGREIEEGKHRVSERRPEVRLAVRGLAGPEFDDVSFDVHAGEIVGIGGILGSGREQVAAALFGALPGTDGDVRVDGRAIPLSSPAPAIRAGIGYVPADRRRHGAIVQMSARENLTLPRLSPLRRALGRLDMRAERREASDWMSEVDVRPATPERPFALFSGGNQQKIVLAKWLRTEPRVLVLDEPTQGVDVGAKAAIYHLIARAAADGAAVLVSSSDTKELTVLCDRVLVLRDGQVAADIGRASLTEATLLKEALGTGGRDARDPFDTSDGGSPS